MYVPFKRRVDESLAAVARERVAHLGVRRAPAEHVGPGQEDPELELPPGPEHVPGLEHAPGLEHVPGPENGAVRGSIRIGGWVPRAPSPDQLTGHGGTSPRSGPVVDRLPLVLRAVYERWAPQLARCRTELGRGQVVVVTVVLAVGLAAAAAVYSWGRPETVPVEAEEVSAGSAYSSGSKGTPGASGDAENQPGERGSRAGAAGTGPAPAGSSETPALVVHVTGKVKRPGVVSVPAGSRVIDAIEAAGGADAGVDMTPLNLARVLTDGEQVLVGVEPPPGQRLPPPASDADGAEGPVDGPVNLNTASVAELESLPGVGPTLAQRIVDWRNEHTRFTSVDELLEISGIGPSTFADVEPLVVL